MDIVTLQNPFDHLHRDSDVEGMSDGWDNGTACEQPRGASGRRCACQRTSLQALRLELCALVVTRLLCPAPPVPSLRLALRPTDGYNDVADDASMGWARYAHSMRIFVFNSGLFYLRCVAVLPAPQALPITTCSVVAQPPTTSSALPRQSNAATASETCAGGDACSRAWTVAHLLISRPAGSVLCRNTDPACPMPALHPCFSPTQASKDLLDKLIYRVETENGWDQALFNECIFFPNSPHNKARLGRRCGRWGRAWMCW